MVKGPASCPYSVGHMTPHRRLAAWKTARLVVRIVLRASRHAWKPYLHAVFSQLQRSSLSVQLNIAEGYAYGRTRRCRNHLEIAYASAVETEDLLDLLSDENVLPPSEATEALDQCRRCQALLKGLIRRYPSTEPPSHRATEPPSHLAT